MAHKIQEELDQVERQVYVLEKEENELRRVRYLKRFVLSFPILFLYLNAFSHVSVLYCNLLHAMEDTANQNARKPLYI